MDRLVSRCRVARALRYSLFLAVGGLGLVALLALPRSATAAPVQQAAGCWTVYLPLISNGSSMSALIRNFSLSGLIGGSATVPPGGTLLATVPVGNQPTRIAVNPTANKAYVTNFGANTVSVIDTTKNIVINTITVGGSPRGIAYNPNTNLLYVANSCQLTKSTCSPSLSVIDSGTDTVVATIPLSSYPWHVDLNPNTNLVYVTLYAAGQLAVVDGATNKVTALVTLGGRFLYSPAVNPNTNLIYVSNGDPSFDEVQVVDGATNTLIQTIPVGGAPDGEAVDTVLNQVYVSNQFPSQTTGFPSGVTVINGAPGGGNGCLGNVPIGAPDAIAANSTTHQVFAGNLGNGSDSVIVFDGSGPSYPTDAILTVNPTPNGVAVDPLTNIVYVSSQGANTVQAFSP